MSDDSTDPSRRPLRAVTSRDHYEPTDAPEIGPVEILHRVAALRLRTWRSRSSDGAPGRHLAPGAEEFYDRFELGRGPARIPAGDIDGVALAAIQGLWALVEQQARALERQADRIDRQARELERQADRLSDQRDDIEALREHVETLHGELARLR